MGVHWLMTWPLVLCLDAKKHIVLAPLCVSYFICFFDVCSLIDNMTIKSNYKTCWLISFLVLFVFCVVSMMVTVHILCATRLNLLIFMGPICVFSFSFGIPVLYPMGCYVRFHCIFFWEFSPFFRTFNFGHFNIEKVVKRLST